MGGGGGGLEVAIFFIRRWHSFTRTRRLAGHVIVLDRRRLVRREGGTGETAAYAVFGAKKTQSMGDKTGTVSGVSLVLDFHSRRWKPAKIKAKIDYSVCLTKFSEKHL